MPTRTCPQCHRRLPYAGRRCRPCGWRIGQSPDPTVSRAVAARRGWVWFVALLLLTVGGVAATLNSAAVAEWYASFAARHLPEDLSSYAPSETDVGAFFYCARQVAREMDGEFSVETFASLEESRAERLGDGRYRIRSWVEQARADGVRVRHGFTCEVRYQRGRWALEELTLQERYAILEGDPPTVR